jgi:hypothetical protein
VAVRVWWAGVDAVRGGEERARGTRE